MPVGCLCTLIVCTSSLLEECAHAAQAIEGQVTLCALIGKSGLLVGLAGSPGNDHADVSADEHEAQAVALIPAY